LYCIFVVYKDTTQQRYNTTKIQYNKDTNQQRYNTTKIQYNKDAIQQGYNATKNVVALYPDFSGMVFNATFNNISVISCRSMLLVDGTGVPGETHRPAGCH
jgi:hypothetical protein